MSVDIFFRDTTMLCSTPPSLLAILLLLVLFEKEVDAGAVAKACTFPSGTSSFCNGDWTTSGGDFTWTRNTGSTPSSSTGPSGGPAGVSYVYLEASSPNYPSKTAYLTSSSTQGYSEIHFKYHMYGSNMGSLAVEVKDSTGQWTQVWQQNGQQHNSHTAAWSNARVSFPGTVQQVRFVGVTGSSYTSDAAVADVELIPGLPIAIPSPSPSPSRSPSRSLAYQSVLVSQRCSDLGLSIVDTEQECIRAAIELALGVSSIAVRHSTGARPAGCMDYTSTSAGHQLEFNSDLSSTWTSSSWTDLYQICKQAIPAGYTRVTQGCVNGNHIAKRTGQSVEHCAQWCNSLSTCKAFDFGVAYGGAGSYNPGDCQPQSALPDGTCDGAHFNLDLYIKRTVGDGTDGVYKFGGAVGDNLWKLVRRVKAGNTWHPATDRLLGTDVYGTYDPSDAADSTFSIQFDTLPCDEFLFATGDRTKWLVAKKSSVIGAYYANQQRAVERSSANSQPHTIAWYNRASAIEDPWVSITDHSSAIAAADIVYGGNNFGGTHAQILSQHNGANVFCLAPNVASTPAASSSPSPSPSRGPGPGAVAKACTFPSGMSSFCNGDWTTSGGDFTWTRNTGSTPSSSTGPSGGPAGVSYVYLEASSPNYPSKTAYLTSSSTQGYSEIHFKYHMYGSNMGSLAVEVKDSTGQWTQVWQQNGQQHNSHTAAWSNARVSFPGTVRQVRFVGVTGSSYTSDAAVADVELIPIAIPSPSLSPSPSPSHSLPPTCSDSVQNGDESQVDCGGSCPACASLSPVTVPPGMVFYGRGCCRFDGWTGGLYQGKQTEAACVALCVNDSSCIAADIARPDSSKYDCHLFQGSGQNFRTACNTTNDFEKCFKKTGARQGVSCTDTGSGLWGSADWGTKEVTCPNGCQGSGAVWGVGLFTGDSAICSAAIFSGVIMSNGGVVTLSWAQGQTSYAGGSQNGVTSSSHGPWGVSFRIEGSCDRGWQYIGCYPETSLPSSRTYWGHATGAYFVQSASKADAANTHFMAMSRHAADLGHAFFFNNTPTAMAADPRVCENPCTDDNARRCGCADEDSRWPGGPAAPCSNSGQKVFAAYKRCGGCFTQSGPQSGKLCIFPFTYNGVEYTECPSVGNSGVPWCATVVNASGSYISGKWGNCGPGCSSDDCWDTATADTGAYNASTGRSFTLRSGGILSIIFKVQASNDAHLGLFTSAHDLNNMYEIVIGGWGNSKSVVRKSHGGTDLVTVLGAQISSISMTEMWLSLSPLGKLSIGTGSTVGQNAWMSWTDPSPLTITEVVPMTGWGASGIWRLCIELSHGCATGYSSRTGDVAGWGEINGKGNGQSVPDCDGCATLCSSEPSCMSYECSPSALKCNLNTAATPTQTTYLDYMFCSRGGRDCKDIKTRDAAAASGEYTLANGLTVWCDMTGLDGTGWALIAVKANTATATQAAGAVLPTDTGKVLSDVSWLQLRKSMAGDGAAMAFINSGTQNYMNAPVLLLDSVDRLWTGNCKSMTKSLSEFPWAHNENSGCNGMGSDYSYIMGASAIRQNSFTDRSWMTYGLQVCTSHTLGSSCNSTGGGYYEYATTAVYVQLHTVAAVAKACTFPSGTSSFCNGDWTTSGGDFTWTRNTGSTPSSSTGPSGGPAGVSYVYLEASSPNYPSKTAYLTSSSTQGYSEIHFKYHMYGSNMGSLAVEVKDSTGQWTQVWQQNGQQHNSHTAAWSNARVSFPGTVQQVRFVGVTGSSYTSDAAVADVELIPGLPIAIPSPSPSPSRSPSRSLAYQSVLVSQRCSDLGLSIVDTEQECIRAAIELALGVSSIAVRHSTGARPAGCMDYTSTSAGHQLEFNSDLSSTWTSSSWTDLYQICKQAIPAGSCDRGSQYIGCYPEISIPSSRTYVTCSCSTPGAGTNGQNYYSCSDGTSGHCSAIEECHARAPFEKGQWGDGCRVPPVYIEKTNVGPAYWSSRLPGFGDSSLSTAKAKCNTEPRCHAITYAARGAGLKSGSYTAGRYYGMSGTPGAHACGIVASDLFFSGWKYYYKGLKYTYPTPGANGFRHRDVTASGSCTTYDQATCDDGHQNQGETGVDCGGPCRSCSSQVTAPAQLWHGDSCKSLVYAGQFSITTCKTIPTGLHGPSLYAKIGCDDTGNAAGQICWDASCHVCEDIAAAHGQCSTGHFFGMARDVQINCLDSPAGPCGCEADGDKFCNFDYGSTGLCESCTAYSTASDCDHDGLPSKGAADCKARCFGATGMQWSGLGHCQNAAGDTYPDLIGINITLRGCKAACLAVAECRGIQFRNKQYNALTTEGVSECHLKFDAGYTVAPLSVPDPYKNFLERRGWSPSTRATGRVVGADNNGWWQCFAKTAGGGGDGLYQFGGAIGNDVWKLVRRVKAGDAWHPATDHLAGTEAYGAYSPDSQAHSTFSLRFDLLPCEEFLFATGDLKKWLVAKRSSVVDPKGYDARARRVERSSATPGPHTVQWLNRPASPEDPCISVTDHPGAGSTGDVVYSGNGRGGTPAQVLAQGMGANVFCRLSSGGACPTGDVTVTVTTAAFAKDVGWSIASPSATAPVHAVPYSAYANYRTFTHCLPLAPGPYVFRALDKVGDGWDGGTFTVALNDLRLIGPVTVTGSAEAHRFTVSGSTDCGSGAIALANIALGLTPQVNSTCNASDPLSLTDGEYPCHASDGGYWQSCPGPEQWVHLPLPTPQCVRSVRIWSRCTAGDDSCCSSDMIGAQAEVRTSEGWQPCSPDRAPDVGPGGAFDFPCHRLGSEVRVSRAGDGVFSLSEVEVFPEQSNCTQAAAKVDAPGCQSIVVNHVTPATSPDLFWTILGTCHKPLVARSVFAPSPLHSTVVCLAPGAYQFVANGTSFGDSFTVALLDGSEEPLIHNAVLKPRRLNANFVVPAGPMCRETTVDVPNCIKVSVTVTTANVTNGAFRLRGACPPVAMNASEFPVNASHTTTVCLAPGRYTFVATAPHGGGWGGGTFSVRLPGPFDPLIWGTEVAGFGLRAEFRVPHALPDLTRWLFQDDDKYYINLPPIDNWSQYYPLRTTWQKLRVQGEILRGQTQVYVDLTDTTYATSNGRTSHTRSLTHVPWGVAKDCRGGGNTSGYHLSLHGTPFRLLEAHGTDKCDGAQERCDGACGGACGVCGFVYGVDTQLVRLVVKPADQARFDNAIARSCGRPQMPNADFSACDWHFMGTCTPVCRYPYAGVPTAVCSRDGNWAYGGSCATLALAFTMGYNNFGQLGLADTGPRNFPEPLSAPNQREITALAVGGWHTAFLTETQAYVMGANGHGQLGLDVPHAHSPRPLDAPNARAITAIATGSLHTVFVAGGQAYLMGDNRRGQLGLPARVLQRGTPHAVRLPTRAPVRAVAAGSFHTVLLTAADPVTGAGAQAYVMGLNTRGMLGLADTVTRYAPRLLRAPNGAAITAVALGRWHSAVLAGGECFVFGSNAHGQLGLGAVNGSLAPKRLVVDGGKAVTAVAAGHRHTALVAGGQLWVMGSNEAGQLGLEGPDSSRGPGARRRSHVHATPRSVDSPNGAAIEQVAAGGSATAFIAGRRCYVMGYNANGQLGLRSYVDQRTPALLESPNGNAITSIAVGPFHSAFLAATTITPTMTPSASSTPTSSPSQTSTHTSTATHSTSHTATTSPTSSFTRSPSPSHTATPTTTSSPTSTATPSVSSSGSVTSSPAPSRSHSPTASCTGSRTSSGSVTRTGPPTVSATATPTMTATSTPTTPPTATLTASISSTVTMTSSSTASSSVTLTASCTASSTPSPSSTHTRTPTVTATATNALTATMTPTMSRTSTLTASISSSVTITSSLTASGSNSPTASCVASNTPSTSITHTGTPTGTATATEALTATTPPTSTSTTTLTASISSTVLMTSTSTASGSTNPTVSCTSSNTRSPDSTSTNTPTFTATATNALTATTTSPPTFTVTRSVQLTMTSTSSCSSTLIVTPTLTATTTPTPTSTPLVSPSPSSTQTHTPPVTATLTNAVTFTSTTSPSMTSSVTATASATVAQSLTLTMTPTTTRSSTSTPLLSSTPSSTHTPTPTVTATPTIAVTFTSTLTPSMTSSVTSTSSATFVQTLTSTMTSTTTLSTTATPGMSCTSTTTPTPSQIFTPISTLTSTPSSTSSHTPAPSVTASMTQTFSSPATQSWSPTTTALPTATTSPTATPQLEPCTGASVVSGAVTLQATGRKCMESFGMGVGSSSLVSRQVAIRILRLPGTLRLRLDSGCTSSAPGCPNCTACTRQYGPQDVGRKDVLPVGAADIQVLMLYDPPAATRRQLPRNAPRTADFSVEFVVVHAASSLTVVVVAAGLFAAVPCCVWGSRAHARWIVSRPLPYQYYVKHQTGLSLRHPRWASPWVQVGLAMGLLLMLIGIAWYLVLRALRHADTDAFSAELLGFGIFSAGLTLSAAVGLRALREDERRRCPTCQGPASSWRFSGVYIPRTDEGGAGAVRLDKAHTRCVRCVVCGRPVVVDAWPGAPPGRAYHNACWRALRDRLCAHPEEVAGWCAAPALTDAERAHMLAASVCEGSPATTAALLTARPELDAHPLRGGPPTALHTAAAAGQLPALVALLERRPDWLDARPAEDSAPAYSLRIAGLAQGQGRNDLYVPQPPLSYCGRPVYVGHTHGHYLYWYQPLPNDKAPRPAGWCLSDYLGSGAPSHRLCLGDTPERRPTAHERMLSLASLTSAAAETARGSATFWQRLRHRTKTMTPRGTSRGGGKASKWWLPHAPALSPCVSKDSGIAGSHTGTATALAVPPHEFSAAPDPAAPEVACLSPEDVGLQWVPQAFSLLEAAVSSGHPGTIQHVVGLYKARHPASLRWQHHIGDGLWATYPTAVQQQIAQALARGVGRFVPGQQPGPAPATVDLEALQQLRGETAQPLRWHLQTMVLCSPGDGPTVVTSDIAEVRDWGMAFVGATSGGLAAAAPNPATLALLVRLGAVDPSLWAPACKEVAYRAMDGVPPAKHPMFAAVLDEFLTAALEIPDGVFEGAGGGRAAERRAVVSRMFAAQRSPAPDGGVPAAPGGRRLLSESRMVDGLTMPDSGPTSTFYDEGYTSDTGTLEFCMALPENPLGLPFEQWSLGQMCAECVLKVWELGRQRVTFSPQHIVPIYVYTYELPDDGETDQIYGAMNRAMRLHDAHAIAFWRPLIWQVDCALQLLPKHTGKLYRGISVRFSEQDYREGQHVCWPALSSASAERAVAQAFVKGDEGSLFFIQSTAGRAISKFSKFPDEAEVLFRPNTMFEITSTLYNTSVIGEFYSGTDNIAMVELTGAGPSPGPALGAAPSAGRGARAPVPAVPHALRKAARILVDVPEHFFFPLLNVLTGSAAVAADILELRDCAEEGRFAQLVAMPTADEAGVRPLPEPERRPVCFEAAEAPPDSPALLSPTSASHPNPGLTLAKAPSSPRPLSQAELRGSRDSDSMSSPFFPWHRRRSGGALTVDFSPQASAPPSPLGQSGVPDPSDRRRGSRWGTPPASLSPSPKSGASVYWNSMGSQRGGAMPRPQRLPAPMDPQWTDGREVASADVEKTGVTYTPLDSVSVSMAQLFVDTESEVVCSKGFVDTESEVVCSKGFVDTESQVVCSKGFVDTETGVPDVDTAVWCTPARAWDEAPEVMDTELGVGDEERGGGGLHTAVAGVETEVAAGIPLDTESVKIYMNPLLPPKLCDPDL